ncbi:hypothetical protein EMIT0P44_300036 [Pseudomonas sp. IT-P44]
MPPAPPGREETKVPLMYTNRVGARLAREEALKDAKSFAGKPRSYRYGVMPQMTEHPAMRDNAGQFQE